MPAYKIVPVAETDNPYDMSAEKFANKEASGFPRDRTGSVVCMSDAVSDEQFYGSSSVQLDSTQETMNSSTANDSVSETGEETVAAKQVGHTSSDLFQGMCEPTSKMLKHTAKEVILTGSSSKIETANTAFLSSLRTGITTTDLTAEPPSVRSSASADEAVGRVKTVFSAPGMASSVQSQMTVNDSSSSCSKSENSTTELTSGSTSETEADSDIHVENASTSHYSMIKSYVSNGDKSDLRYFVAEKAGNTITHQQIFTAEEASRISTLTSFDYHSIIEETEDTIR